MQNFQQQYPRKVITGGPSTELYAQIKIILLTYSLQNQDIKE